MAKSFPNTGATLGLAADRTALTSPFAGMQFFETDTNRLFIYSGTTWVETNDVDNTNGVPSGLNPFFAGYTAYTPTLVQSGTVPKTSTSYYLQVGKFVHGYFQLTVSGAGGTGNNAVIVSLPVAIRSGFNEFTIIGTSTVYDASTGSVYPGLMTMSGRLSVTQTAHSNGQQYLGINNFGVALATGDIVGGSFTYEAA